MSTPPIDLPSDLRQVVHPFRRSTRGYLVWASDGPRRLCEEEVRRIGRHRDLRTTKTPLSFPKKRPASWVVALLAADVDEASRGIEWARTIERPDRARLGFFLLPDVDAPAVEAMSMKTLGMTPVIVAIEPRFTSFHPAFGLFLNRWTYYDVKAGRIK